MSKPYQIWRITSLIATAFVVLLSSCQKESEENLKPSMSLPLVYDSTGFSYNTEPVKPLILQFMSLIQEMQKGRQGGTYVSEEALNSAFTQGSFPLQSATSPYYSNRLQAQNNGFFAELSKASNGYFYPFDRNWEGGVYGSYLFDEYGLEMEQMIEKGLYGATLYNYAMSLINETIKPATADQLLILYGANPRFFNSDNTRLYQNPDRLMAVYAARRDDGSGTGLYSQTRLAFIKLQTALLEGNDYNAYRDEALATIKLNWEKTNAAAVVHNLHTVVLMLNATNINDQQRSEVLHLISEAAGFMHGWRSIDGNNKKITDTEIDGILELLNAPYDRSASVYRFVTNSKAELPKLMEAVSRIQGIYGFTNDEIESFRHNWVSEQDR